MGHRFWVPLQGHPVRRGGLGSAHHSRVRQQQLAGMRALHGELLASCAFRVEVRRQEGMIAGQYQVPLSLSDAVSFLGCGECVPRTFLAGYMC